MNDGLGKKAEQKIKEWLDNPEKGYCFDRLPDQMSGVKGSSNICDFTLFKCPHYYYIESKATYEDRFDFAMISPYQHDGMLSKSKIRGVRAYIVVLFASHQRAFVIDIRSIDNAQAQGVKSVNINKIDKWPIQYHELTTIHSRKQLLDYLDTIDDVRRSLDFKGCDVLNR